MTIGEFLRAAIIMFAGLGMFSGIIAAAGYSYFKLATSDMPERRASDRRLLPVHIWLAALGYGLICAARIWQSIESFHEPATNPMYLQLVGYVMFDAALMVILVHTKKRSESSTRRRIDFTLGRGRHDDR